MMKSPEPPENVESINNQLTKAYIAGVVDGNSTLTANVYEDDTYAIGYRIEPKVQITRSLPFSLQVADDFCMDNGIMSKLNQVERKGNRRFEFHIYKAYSIRRFLNMIYPFLRDRREEADLLANRIIPPVDNNEHLHKESFAEIVKDIDTLREMNPKTTRTEYDYEYFKNEWDL